LFKIFVNAWRVEDIRKKLLFIFLLLLIYRFGSAIPLPGIDINMLYEARHGIGDFQVDAVMTIFAMIMGGGLGSIFAMGIAPYITASIIMQLMTYAFPKLSEMQKEPDGRKKITQITRYLSVGLAAIQAAAMVFSYTNWPPGHVGWNLFREGHQNIMVYGMATVAMMSGTIFIMWLAELLSEKAIGSGASFLIFANILASLPMGVMTFWNMATGTEPMVWGFAQVILILLIFVAIMGFVVLVHEGERRIPVQHSKKQRDSSGTGGTNFGNNNSYIPLKVNIAGVMSIIFAVSLLQFPAQIAMFFPSAPEAPNNFLETVAHWLRMEGPVGAIIYVVLIFMFTHFYTSFAVNPVEMAENLKKNGGFIPGVRPGKPTSDFIAVTVNRLSWIGAVFYSLIALVPIVLGWFMPEIGQLHFGGTTLLIVTGVALEFVKQLESQLIMRNYKGFLD
jgi:preprotein translocase subunit SecY